MDTENTNNSAADATNTGGAAPNTPEVVFSPVTAPEEQKSPELATTTPKTPLADLEDKPAGQTAADGSTAEKPAGKEAPDLVSQLLQETMRREDAERRLQALAPKKEPLKEPVISDFKTLEDYNKAMLTYGKALGAEEVSQQNERNKLIQRAGCGTDCSRNTRSKGAYQIHGLRRDHYADRAGYRKYAYSPRIYWRVGTRFRSCVSPGEKPCGSAATEKSFSD
jgi:hypothetical protein